MAMFGNNDAGLNIVVRLVDEASAQLKALGVSIGEVNNKTSNLGIKVGGTEVSFKKMAAVGAAGTAAISYGALQSVKAFESFNKEIQRAGAFINASEDEMQSFRKAAMDAAKGTSYTFEQVAAAIGNFVGGEIDAKTATEELGSVIDLALVGGIQDLQKAVNIGSNALTVFAKDGMEMSDVVDIMATVAADVTTETDAWATSLNNSAGSAKAAGMSFKDLNVLFAAMNRGGADVNLMWSAFNSAITRVQAPTKQTIEALDSVGLSTKGLQDALASGPVDMLQYLKKGFEEANKSGQGFAFLTNVLGAQAAPEFALALGLTNEEMAETAAYFDEIGGRGADMVQRLKDGQSATEKLGQQMTALNITMGSALAPALSKIVEAITPLIEKLAAWVEQNPEITAWVVGITAGLFALVGIIGTLGIALPAIAAGFAVLAGPVGIIIAIVGTLIFTITQLIGIFKILRDDWDLVWAGIKIVAKDAVNFLIGIAEGWANTWVKAANTIIGALNKIKINIPSWVPGIGGKSFGINLPLVDEVKLPRFEFGGTVPGARGTAVPIMAHGQETIIPAGVSQGRGDGVYIELNMNYPQFKSREDADEMRTQIDRALRDVIRTTKLRQI